MKAQILVIGRHAEIMQTVLRLIHQNPDWEAKGALTDEEAIQLFAEHNFDLVLLGGGVESASEQKFRDIFTAQNPKIKIIQHFGGGSGLLSNEIQHALAENSGYVR
jgi:DNA-binding NarL/FixJ family response regulator